MDELKVVDENDAVFFQQTKQSKYEFWLFQVSFNEAILYGALLHPIKGHKY